MQFVNCAFVILNIVNGGHTNGMGFNPISCTTLCIPSDVIWTHAANTLKDLYRQSQKPKVR